MKSKTATAFVAGFGVAMLLGFLRPAPKPHCDVGDITGEFAREDAKNFEGVRGWAHNARVCNVGDYIVAGPDRRGSTDLLVGRPGEPLLVVQGSDTMLLYERRVVYAWDRAKAVISYAGYDSARQAWIDNIDAGADGTIDVRSTEIADRPKKWEFRIGDRWFDMSYQDGKNGLMVDGRFMTVDEARKALTPAATR